MQSEPFSSLIHFPWIRWIDRTGFPAVVIGLITFLLFLPFYDFSGMIPRLPYQGGVYPAALALSLMFYLQLTRGAMEDLRLLVGADKLDTSYIDSIAAHALGARLELFVGVMIGSFRAYQQLNIESNSQTMISVVMSPAPLVVCLSIVGYTVLQIHLLAFCFRQVLVFRRIAKQFRVDLLRPELNNALSNPVIRLILLGLVAMSFVMLIYQVAPFPSIQQRIIGATIVVGLVWLLFVAISLVPVFILHGRISIAKKMEISLIRLALNNDYTGIHQSQFGKRLANFTPGELMYYEDRINNIWDWPIEAHIRRLVIFGLLPPLTWVLAAAVEVIFEAAIK